MHPAASTTALPTHPDLAGFVRAGVHRVARAVALSLPRLVRDALLIMALLAINSAGTPGAIAFFVILAGMMFVSPEAAFKAMAICYVGLMINSAFVPKTLVWTPARLVIPFLAVIRFSIDMAALRMSLFTRPSYLALLLFTGVMAVCSVVSGWYTQIALLKLVNFLVFLTAVFAGTAVLRRRRSDVGEWFVSLIIAASLFGILAVAMGVQSNFRPLQYDPFNTFRKTAFNGAFMHPNAHAIYAPLFLAFLGIVWLLSRYRRTWLVLPVMACWIVFIAWSESRTAFIAAAAAAILLVALARPLRSRFGWRLAPRMKRGTLAALGVAGVVALLFWNVMTGGALGKSFMAYIVKGGASDSDREVSLERIVYSRKGLIEFSWQNFRDHPATGIGFGVAKTDAFREQATLFTAPSEKGFLPTAILEEGGVLGTTAFLVFLAALSWELFRERNLAGLIMLGVFVVTNFGEVTIFAPGGGGAFGWMSVSAGMILGDRCWSPPRIPQAPPPAVNTGWRP